ncbi:MAG: hypothetical protein ABI999_13580 [Acidobacteriota bacterium]
MVKPTLFISLLITILCFSSSGQNKSVYTSTKTNACRTIESNPDEAGSYIGECRGVGGYKVQLLEGDIRQTLNIITPSRKKFELNFWALYGGFSAIGEKIEWRTKAGVPVALIARYNVANADDSTKSTSYLMISKIARRSSCVTDVVKPGPKQNEQARILADAAAGRPCMQ